MTRRSMLEYAQELRCRYFRSSKAAKSRMLDEFTQITGLHRKAAIRLLHRADRPKAGKRRGRPKQYGSELLEVLKAVWEASDRLCSRRLQPFIFEMVSILVRHGELHITADVESQIRSISASTIDRLLRPYRKPGGRKSLSTTRPGSLLKSCIPIRTFADWKEEQIGFMETDLVAHCGESAEGFYLNTLCAVDIAGGWTECLPVWGKWQEKVRQSIHRMRTNLPFSLLGIDSDNGSEFINQCLYNYCRSEEITFTRSRSYKKNDSCHVEQKNGNVVRRLVGYDRYSSKAAFERLGRVYDLVRLYINFFQPTMKLISKTRHGASVHKVYDTARTSYHRLMQTGVLNEAKKSELVETYNRMNPVLLLKNINSEIEKLWQSAERSGR